MFGISHGQSERHKLKYITFKVILEKSLTVETIMHERVYAMPTSRRVRVRQ